MTDRTQLLASVNDRLSADTAVEAGDFFLEEASPLPLALCQGEATLF